MPKRTPKTPEVAPKKGSTSKKVVKKTTEPKKVEHTDAHSRSLPLSLSSYIVKVSKSANDNVGVRKNVKERIEQLLLSFIRLVNKHSEENLKSRKTLQERDIEHAIRVFIPEGDFRTHVLERADTVLKTFVEKKKTEDLNMSVPRTRAWLVWGLSDRENLHVSRNAVVYLAGALDQFVEELTKEANVYSKEKERSNITLPDFNKAVKKNDWLNAVLVVLDENTEAVEVKEEAEASAPPPVVLKKTTKRPPIKKIAEPVKTTKKKVAKA